jgi:CubicO group peptidase (beta-lactamase class C family)
MMMPEPSAAYAPLAAVSDPGDLGFDAQRLARVEASIGADIENHEYDGAALIVGRSGQTAFTSIQGFAQRASQRMLQSDDVLVTFSSGKQFTVAAVLHYVEQGLLQLHRPVAEVIPEFAANGKAKINLAHLLTHTSGIPPFAPLANPLDLFNLEQSVAAICRMAPDTLPGQAVRYSITTAHAVMAEMVRRVDGGTRPFRQIMAEEIFAPLGMRDTALGLPDHLRERVCPVVVSDRSPGLLDPEMLEGTAQTLTPESEMPAGGYVTTIADFARFAEMLRNGGELDGARILSPAMIEAATRNHTGDMPNDIWNYCIESRNWPVFPANLGLGFFLRGEGAFPTPFGTLASPRTFGGVGAGSTCFHIDPERDLFVAFLSTGLLEESRSMERHQRIADLIQAAVSRAT